MKEEKKQSIDKLTPGINITLESILKRRVYINGREFTDNVIVDKNGKTYVPMIKFAQALGGKVTDEKQGGYEVTIDKKTFIIHDLLFNPPCSTKFVHVKFVEAIGYKAIWDATKNRVDISPGVDKSIVYKVTQSTVQEVGEYCIVKYGIERMKETSTGITKMPSIFGHGFEMETITLKMPTKALKSMSKYAGPLAVGSFIRDVYSDNANFEGTTKLKAIGLTSAGTVLTLSITAGLAATSLPVVVTLGAGITIGMGIQAVVDHMKEDLKKDKGLTK